MFKEREALYLKDILGSIQSIKSYTYGFTFEQFLRDPKTQDAVLRNLEVVGEAARHITKETKKNYSEIPWRQIVDMRNKVIHEYFGVDLKILWKTVQEDIPYLEKEIKKILEN
ncbi:hypothetical protein A2316_01790 [Candidatus Falkowbacteria bacterium RIFOXYB2_FULL_38_15]|uniref:DUF86 domain-containing protein n=1 Tax=Candidatus Falkowbacteria bacterium RIFOXYA2_FULL_38_12 TaxID=1797993 RepID=A0A1F5S284_9BACT|nr:MAG: hypothetical protein A2257_03570 [Candidatus Falkowbacteria bacterium RIFOXYA2_FULL_38_12]OGF32683.1 MAG: hypothetical protein A2316_01790 [Candidatus Falkowbacteria bacterium RIFOXYB2_FULL_38_15]OGF42087.1 MAG: hypothetical protein A2555_01685 [Candidatus Falkowbacteria bacterium RIFOXYD2_FULL_39_16]